MLHIERYHAPLRAAFNKIRDSLPRSDTDQDCLQMDIKAVNDSVGPKACAQHYWYMELLAPCTNSVRNSIPRPPRRTPADTQLKRARDLDDATAAVRKEKAKRRISFAMSQPSSP